MKRKQERSQFCLWSFCDPGKLEQTHFIRLVDLKDKCQSPELAQDGEPEQ